MLYYKGGGHRAQITLEELYYGEQYNIMGNAMVEYLSKGDLWQQDADTTLELLIVKHTLLAAQQMRITGDTVQL